MTYKIAIIGAGYMAGEHARAFASLPNVKIAGVCSRSTSRAQALAAKHNAPVYKTIDALYAATQADAVVIAVNELSARDVCLEAFNHPWLCLIEKPVGIDLPEAEEIAAAAARKKVRAYVALNRRSYSATRQALQQLSADNGPRLISVVDQQDMTSARDGGQPERVVQNYMFANSIHLIDYLAVFGRGEVVRVTPTTQWNPTNQGYVVATVEFSSGDIATYQAVWNGPGPWAATVTNPAIRVELRPLERLSIQRRGERRLSEVPADPIDTEFKPGLRHQAEQVIAVLCRQESTLATIDDSLRSMRLCAQIYGLGR